MNAPGNVVDPEWIRRLRTRHDKSDRKPCTRGLCHHAANLHEPDGTCITSDAKKDTGTREQFPCAR